MMSLPGGALPCSFYIRTFGCQMNAHDSEHIAGVLEAAGYWNAQKIESADLVIFNTCCVREGAEDRVWGNLGSIAYRSTGLPLVAVCGCMAEKHGVDILWRSPVVRLVFGMDSLSRLTELLEGSVRTPACDLGDVNAASIDYLPEVRRSTSKAWVPVSLGCDNRCSYCVVPGVRGKERSRAPSDVLDEVHRLASAGVIEVTLLGQNVNTYGRDLDKPTGFAGLLRAVASVPGIRRVKFETSHPRDMGDDILDAMAGSEAACEYLHLPVQSGSDRILEAMNRGYDRDFYIERVLRARKLVSGVTVSTDIIVGFPTETEQDFSHTLDLVKAVKFDAAYMFIYSPREGTAAFELEDDVPARQKQRRLADLAQLQGEITERSLSKVVGSNVEVLVDGPGRVEGQVVGRSRGHRVVLLSAEDAPIDSLVRAAVVDAGRHSLRGRVEEILLRSTPGQ